MHQNILGSMIAQSEAELEQSGSCGCGCSKCRQQEMEGETTAGSFNPETYRSINQYYGIEDFTGRADLATCARYRNGQSCTGGIRSMTSVDAVVLHQTAGSQSTDPRHYFWVGAHYVVMPDGRILQLHTENKRIYHANGFNLRSIGIEFAGTFPNESGTCRWAKGVTKRQGFRSGLRACEPPTAAQYEAGRRLLTALTEKFPQIRYVFAHRQSSGSRDNDPGPDLWRNLGEWAIVNLGLSDGPTANYKIGSGKPIPPSWRMPLTAGEFEFEF